MKKIFIFIIKIYQKTLSLDQGLLSKIFPVKVCIFTPTCSQYTIEAIEKYGVLKGIYLGFLRILRCNPFSKGGCDPVK
jgi:uncharacterized protein